MLLALVLLMFLNGFVGIAVVVNIVVFVIVVVVKVNGRYFEWILELDLNGINKVEREDKMMMMMMTASTQDPKWQTHLNKMLTSDQQYDSEDLFTK